MTTEELTTKLAEAIARFEGYYMPGTRANRQENPGNVRRWRDRQGNEYPRNGGYVDFVAWAQARMPGASSAEVRKAAEREGWRVLRLLIRRYLAGRYTGGRTPTLQEMFAIYAPAEDGNNPLRYAEFVAAQLGIRPDIPLGYVLSDAGSTRT